MNLHFPDFDPRSPACSGHPRRPVPLWMLLAFIGAVLGVALVVTATVPDTRTFAERHMSVPTGARAL